MEGSKLGEEEQGSVVGDIPRKARTIREYLYSMRVSIVEKRHRVAPWFHEDHSRSDFTLGYREKGSRERRRRGVNGFCSPSVARWSFTFTGNHPLQAGCEGDGGGEGCRAMYKVTTVLWYYEPSYSQDFSDDRFSLGALSTAALKTAGSWGEQMLGIISVVSREL